jgi:AbrB family looped-hinge helix DNA binding protein
MSQTTRVGKRGTYVIPAQLRRKYGLNEGAEVIAEETEDGILLRPAVTLPLEIYSPRRKAELLLNNAVDAEDYEMALREVEALGIDPSTVDHVRP